jgi:cytochrome c oxidase cbb3-type subunit I/II
MYVAEGCYNCHSQMIRPLWAETKRYGEYSKPGEFVYDHPFQWGSRRIGPDLARGGPTQASLDWHVRHLEDPRQLVAQSIMPAYRWLLTEPLDFEAIQSRVNGMAMIGVPYGEAVKDGKAVEMAREQATKLAAELEQQGGYPGMADKKVIALVAYLKRIGTDISAPPSAPPPATAPAPAANP